MGGVNPPFDSLIKDYTKKRWLILALLSVEVGVNVEMLIQSNSLTGSPDNGSIPLMVQVLASPVLKNLLSKICRLSV